MPRKHSKQQQEKSRTAESPATLRNRSRSPCSEDGDDVNNPIVSRTLSEGVLRKASRRAKLSLNRFRHSVHGDVSKDYPEFFENLHANGFSNPEKELPPSYESQVRKRRGQGSQESAENILSSTHSSLIPNGVKSFTDPIGQANDLDIHDINGKNKDECQIEVITPTKSPEGPLLHQALIHTQTSHTPHMMVVSVTKSSPAATRLQLVPCSDWSLKLTPITEDGVDDLVLTNPMLPELQDLNGDVGHVEFNPNNIRPRNLSVFPAHRRTSKPSPSLSSPAMRSLPTLSPSRSLSSLASPRPYLAYLRQQSGGRGRQSLLDECIGDHHPEDDPGFFARGRDFESVYTNHRYTQKEREILSSHDSFDYLPSHNPVYKEWLQRQPARLDWDRWVMMGMIGITIGIVGFLLHQIIHLISEIKWEKAAHYMHENMLKAWGWALGYSVIFASFSALSVVFVSQPAGGSGIPEVIGFLNGTVMRHVLNLRSFLVKFFSCCCAVGAGLPVGPEGPMIHMGSIVGTGLSQFRSRTLRFSLPFFSRFRNSEDRRNFTTAGAAAGVAAAFGAPVGGLLFAMEEVSSFWSMKLGWMIFFCCMLATSTADLFNSSMEAFRLTGNFGLFETDKYIIFKVGDAIPVNVIMFAPAAFLGIIGGLLGATFTIMNLKIARLRRKLISKIKRPAMQNAVKFLEPPIIMIIWATITVFLPAAFPCKPVVCPNMTSPVVNDTSPAHASSRPGHVIVTLDSHGRSTEENSDAHASYLSSGHGSHEGAHGSHGSSHGASNESLKFCPTDPRYKYHIDDHMQRYWCVVPTKDAKGNIIHGEYNEVASLLNVPGQTALRVLFSRRTHLQLSYVSLLCVLPLFFILACWAAGTAVASGIVVPTLLIGGLYGRAVGRLLVELHGGVPDDKFWQWIDPGALALIGAASFFAGVSRLTMSLTVIMIEITNDVAFLLPIMVAIMVAKWVGDYITHPLYHSLLELKCIPFLDSEPIVYDEQGTLLNLELFKARDVMHSPVITLTPRESVAHLSHLLLETAHGGFPVVKWNEDARQEVAYGLLTRVELCVILISTEIQQQTQSGVTITPSLGYEEVSIDRLSNRKQVVEILEKYLEKPNYKEVFVDLERYINTSAPRIEENFSLHRTYIIFRTLGLRHLTVVDMANRVVGIISRKDLMGFALEERLEQRKRRGFSIEGGIQKLLPSEQQEALQTTVTLTNH